MITIRDCVKEDFPAIAGLLGQLWPGSAIDLDCLRAAFERGLTSAAQHYCCAVQSGKIVGFCSLTFKNSLWQQGLMAHLDELVVDEAQRGRGIGTQLLSHAIEIAKNSHAIRLELDSAFHRKEAHKFYEQHGFENRALLFSFQLTKAHLAQATAS